MTAPPFYVAERAGSGAAAVAVAVSLFACALPLLATRAPPRAAGGGRGENAGPGLRGAFRALIADLGGVFASRNGLLAFLLCVLPMGSGGAQALFAAIAPDWGASTDLVRRRCR